MKYWIPKLIIIMIVTSLLGISYGYWTEQLYIEGDATLTTEVTIIENIKKPIKVKKTKDLLGKNKDMDEIEIEEQEIPTSDGLLDSVSDEKEKVEKVEVVEVVEEVAVEPVQDLLDEQKEILEENKPKEEIEIVKEAVKEIDPKDMKDMVQE